MSDRFKTRIIQSKPVQLIIQTLLKWQQDECSEMGAALAYHAIFSLFPLLLVILSLVGGLLGSDTDVYNQIIRLAKSSLPPSAYSLVVNTLFHLNSSSVGAGLIGFALLLFAASNVFGALDRFVDKIWQAQKVQPAHNNLLLSVLNFVKGKLYAFGLVLGTAILLLFSLVSRIAIEVIHNFVDEFNQSINFISIDTLLLIEGLQKGAIFLLLSLGIMVLFKILPSAQIAWGDVWLGALITTALIRLLQYLVRNSIVQIGSQFLSYGVVGSVMILLLWIYLTCQLFFLGCEFTYVYAHLVGSRRQKKGDRL